MIKKLAFSMPVGRQLETVNVKVFEGVNGGTYAALDGALFNGWELSMDALDVLIAGLQMVRRAAADDALRGRDSVVS